MSTGAASGLASYLGSLPVAAEDQRGRWAVGDVAPEAVAFPRSVEELAEVLGRASEEGWSVVPAGSGGWIGGGGLPESVDLVVSTRRMTSVVEYEPDDLTVTAEAGLDLGSLARRTREHGQWLAQDPPGWPAASLGAFVATGLPGPLAAGFGRPRDHLLGLTAVSGDGRILRPGGKVVKNVAGFDLVRLLTGSWGALAVVAGATVRLFPVPRREVTLRFDGEEPGALVECGRALATASVVPDALELTWSSGGGDRGDSGGSESPAVLVARIMGSPEAVEEKARILGEAATTDFARLEDVESRRLHEDLAGADLARGEPGAPDGARNGGGDGISLRLSSLPDRLREIVDGARMIERAAVGRGTGGPGAGGPEGPRGTVRVRASASVTRGTLRMDVTGAEASRGAVSVRRWATVLSELRESLAAGGGELTILNGPRALMDAVGSRSAPGGGGALMERIRRTLDPAGVLVPGRLVTERVDR